LPYNVHKLSRQGLRKYRLFSTLVGPGWPALGQCLHHDDTEAPDVSCRTEAAVARLRRIVHRRPGDARRALAAWADCIASEFHLPVGEQDVGWLQPTMHQFVPMEEPQRREHGTHRPLQGARRKAALRQQLRESLLGIFHDDEQELQSLDLT